MAFENINFKNKNSENSRQPYEILQELRGLGVDYFKSESDEDRAEIEQNQRELIRQLEGQVAEILEIIEDPNTPDTERDKLMGRYYGWTMDQLAANIPWPEKSEGKDRDIQNETLEKLQTYLEVRPQAREVARSIFMLFHHGAGVDKDLTVEAHQKMIEGQPPSEEFARQYVEAENKGKIFLEKYIALKLGKESFSLDDDYRELFGEGKISDEQFSYVLDVANWYRRMAYYQKLASLDEGRELNVQRAIELHKKLAEKDPTFDEFLDVVYQEQGISKE